MAKPVFVVHRLQEYQEAIKNLKPHDHTNIKLYRGQKEEWDLLPSLFRKFKNRVHLINEIEKKMLRLLIERVPGNTLRPNNDWDWLSFGQHFRLPTRLLDWSKDPLVALYFAVEGGGISPMVYVYHAQKSQIVDNKAKKDSPSDIDLTRIMTPAVHSFRVALQKGWHTVHRLHPRKSGGRMVIPLQDMNWHKGRLDLVRIDPACQFAIRHELKEIGIYNATIYGDFDAVCDSICQECSI